MSPPSQLPKEAIWRRRWRRLLALAIAAYLAAAALASAGPPGLIGVSALVLSFALAWRSAGASKREAAPFFVAALALASVVGGTDAPATVQFVGDIALVVGLGLATLSLARLSAPPSLAAVLAPQRSTLAIAPVALAVMGLAIAMTPPRSSVGITVALGSSAVFVAIIAFGEMFRRRLELGVRARLLLVMACFVLGLVVAIVMGRLVRSGFSDVVLRGAIAPASLGRAASSDHKR